MRSQGEAGGSQRWISNPICDLFWLTAHPINCDQACSNRERGREREGAWSVNIDFVKSKSSKMFIKVGRRAKSVQSVANIWNQLTDNMTTERGGGGGSERARKR